MFFGGLDKGINVFLAGIIISSLMVGQRRLKPAATRSLELSLFFMESVDY